MPGTAPGDGGVSGTEGERRSPRVGSRDGGRPVKASRQASGRGCLPPGWIGSDGAGLAPCDRCGACLVPVGQGARGISWTNGRCLRQDLQLLKLEKLGCVCLGRGHLHSLSAIAMRRNDAVGSVMLAGSFSARASSFARHGPPPGLLLVLRKNLMRHHFPPNGVVPAQDRARRWSGSGVQHGGQPE